MLDLIYGNIGKKIKILAIVVFALETIAALLGGFLMFFEDFFIGLLIVFVTPILAWISSWTLYAFGELVEKTTENESNTREILKIMKQSNAEPTNNINPPSHKAPTTPHVQTARIKETTFVNDIASQTIICSACGTRQPTNRKVCWHCGASFINEANTDNA